jgi:hypothetical protein
MNLKIKENNRIYWFAALFYLLFIPALLALLFHYSSLLKEILALYPQSPTILSMLASSYLHTTLPHLMSNLGFFFLIMPFVFVFDYLSNKKMLLVNVLLFFVLLPVVSSFLNIVVFREIGVTIPSYGFSAIVAGIFGYLAFSMLHYVRDYHGVRFDKGIFQMMWLILYINLAFISLVYGIYLLVVIIVFFLMLSLINTYRDYGKVFLKMRDTTFFHRIVLFAGFLFSLIAGVQGLFPGTIVVDGTVVNIYAHYVGYIFGFVVPALVCMYIEKR